MGKSEITHPSLRSEQDQAGREEDSREQSSIFGGPWPQEPEKTLKKRGEGGTGSGAKCSCRTGQCPASFGT